MGLFLGRGVRRWAVEDRRRRWIAASPVSSASTFPVILDLAEGLSAGPSGSPLASLKEAVAPDWAAFDGFDLAEQASLLDWDAIRPDESDAKERFLAGSVARAFRLSKEPIGALFRDPQRYDQTSPYLVRRLIQEAEAHGFEVAIDADPQELENSGLKSLLGGFLQRARIVEGPAEAPLAPGRGSAWRLAAVCAHGLPAKVFENLGIELPDALKRRLVPGGGESWLALPEACRMEALEALDEEERRRCHRLIFDHWPPDGWGYLRRNEHALLAGEPGRAVSQHFAYVAGIGVCSREFMFRHMAGMCSLLPAQDPAARRLRIHCLVGAARLAPRVPAENGFEKALDYYHQALADSDTAPATFKITHEIANLYAVQRDPVSLKKSREWFARANAAIQHLSGDEETARAKIHCLNGLALVEYHERNNEKALELEREAMAIARRCREKHPYLAEWAQQLLSANTAKLLEKRFSQLDEAARLLKFNVESAKGRESASARLELARLHFDSGEDRQVAETLAPAFEGAGWSGIDENEELTARFLLTLSLIRLHEYEKAETQLRPLADLSRSVGTPEASLLCGRIEALCRARGRTQE